ncbi:LADA_0F15544g1_1 [Lachancea dasiensis]|uniref:LADA_0F15544g1_1 n=1 Tax=Lachancea dasiensis TaxID=1072105 RepID=A0A1G4JNR0_9SACH|nr:LADA_0F15544g1_1 [Lachancea dasiensis]
MRSIEIVCVVVSDKRELKITELQIKGISQTDATIMSSRNNGQRSRSGCSNCKKAKIKCDEKKPTCKNCIKKGNSDCDYSLHLKWGGRPARNSKKIIKDLPDAAFVNGVLTIARNLNKSAKKATFNFGLEGTGAQALKDSSLTTPSQDILLTATDKGTDLLDGFSAQNALLFPDPLSEVALQNSILDSISPQTFFNPVAVHIPPPCPNILFASSFHSELFGFYLQETSQLFVPTPRHAYESNPFNTILPQMAMQNTTLMKLILAFAANHRKQISKYKRDQQHSLQLAHGCDRAIQDGNFADRLLSETFVQLLSDVTNQEQRYTHTTLATVLMLAGFDIFFSDTRNKWRAHIFGARGLILDKLRIGGENILQVSSIGKGLDAETFLNHWFSYLNIIGSLSSVKKIVPIEKLRPLSYQFEHQGTKRAIYERRKALKDIDYFTGLETKILSLLADVAHLVDRKESLLEAYELRPLFLEALDLDHKILTYINESESERDEIYRQFYAICPQGSGGEVGYDTYKMLRATNAVFGLTGVLQLKRRVLEIPQGSPAVNELLLRISKLIHEEIPFNSSAESCITFCLFCCGCELVGKDLVASRPIFTSHVETLMKKGMASANQAKIVMEDCWKYKKSWWEILEERNLDLAFAI